MDDLKKSAGHKIGVCCFQTPGRVISYHLTATMVTISGLFLLLILLNSCSISAKNPAPNSPPVVLEPSPIQEYEIQVGDELDIKFYYQPELNEEIVVRPDGRISLQLTNEVMAAGLTPAELTTLLTEKYSPILTNPELTVIVQSFGAQKVYVDGEVGRPQMINLVGSMTVLQAITQAQGFLVSAQRDEVVVIRRKADKKPFVIPVNVKAALDGTDISQDIVLQPSDIVYVPKSAIADVNAWVELYLRRNMPFGVGYSLGTWGQ